ncbi:hypothetical protein [Methylococcus sp. EFPC2]|uniref:restriction endonuclease subunit S n=1 Tax=Methylococcus sp. EFPC2 TaxID=2812648 RepID=UPI001968222F|nr:hypothetical protein [Methylococcus sp. EFPC2]QSA98139.1 hypothetical protein JWZ97_04790 [Methylococcus sp. EFPC2]
MKHYPEYRNSGIDWLGEVPEAWPVKRLKFEATLNPSRQSIAHMDRDEQVSFLPMEAIGDDGSLRLDETRPISEVENGYTFFQDSDVTIAKITPCFENGKGAHMRGLANGAGFGTTELIVVRSGKRCRPDFLYYLTQASHFRKRGEGFMYGTGGQKRVPDDYVRDFPVAWPSPDEQVDIADFLADQTREVDALIAEKEELLRLMAEFRATGTTEILTKGLNHEAPMRKCDLPGLEEIPAHWSVLRLKFLAEVQSGIAKGKDVDGIDTVSMPYLRVANVQDGHLNLEEISYLPVAKSEVSRYLLKPFDVLMNEGGDYDKLGRGTIWHGEIEPCIHQNHVFAVRSHEKEDAYWLAAISRTSYAKFYFMGRAKQSTNLASISQRNIVEFPVLLPPREERNELLRAVTDHEAKVDALVEHVKEHIELLREYKSALISEAVTGQIDVRGYAATSSEASFEGQAA